LVANGYAVTASDLQARYGPPTMQQFAVGRLRVSVEYKEGRVAAVGVDKGEPPMDARLAELADLAATDPVTFHSLLPVHVESRFGAPVAERFLAAPGMTLIVTYGGSRAAAEIRIETASAASEIDRVIDELAPPTLRAGTWRGMAMATGCSSVRTDEWENVTITRTYACDPTQRITQATVRFTAKRGGPGGR
jgi:hypothetical protein